MKYFLKQKFFAVGDDFEVFDESGSQVLYFDGKVMALGKKIIVLDSSGNEIARIRRKLFSFRPTYSLSSNGQVLATICKKLFSFRKTFVISVPGQDDITVVGKILEHDYHFYRDGKQVAEVSKKWFRGEDSYSIDITLEKDALSILSGVVIIDLICHPGRDSSFNSKR